MTTDVDQPSAPPAEPTPGAQTGVDPFSRRMRLVVGGLVPLLIAVTFAYSLLSPSGSRGRSDGSTSFSRSAVGFKALAETLEGLGLQVLSSQRTSGQRVDEQTALMILEPPATSLTNLESMVNQAQARGALVVVALPKWLTVPDPDRPGWIASAELLHPARPEQVLASLLEMPSGRGLLARPEGPPITAWDSVFEADAPVLPEPQLIAHAGADLEPLVSGPDGMLVARSVDPPMIIISDPDLVNNAGLHRPGNAAVLAAILGDSPDVTAVVLDETVHGFSRSPSLWRAMIEFPLVVITLHLVLLLVVTVWSGQVRFGPPAAPVPRYTAGAESLIEASAHLLRLSGRSGETMRAYWRSVVRRTATDLGIATQDEEAAIERLADIGRRRRIGTDLARVATAAERSTEQRAGRAQRMAAARQAHACRRELLDGLQRRR
jgi:hypothetical protein